MILIELIIGREPRGAKQEDICAPREHVRSTVRTSQLDLANVAADDVAVYIFTIMRWEARGNRAHTEAVACVSGGGHAYVRPHLARLTTASTMNTYVVCV